MYKSKFPRKSKPEKPVNILNTPYLVIVESPSKCAKIEKFLGFQYKCIASQGHIRGLSKVGSSNQKYQPEFKILSEKQAHVYKMRETIEKFVPSNIYLATDDDREGEAIAWHICEVFDLSLTKTHRILFHEITEKAVQTAIKNPITIRMNIVYAQQARQVIDRMIGFQISPILTKLLVNDSGKFLSAGRCQTPTLRLVYDNDVENKQKKTDQIHYNIHGVFFTHPSTMVLKLDYVMKTVELCETFLEASKTHQHILTIGKEIRKTSDPPKPFNTSHLLQTASNLLHMSPKQTMSLCQKLYQDGHITYMRTDSRKYAGPFIETIQGYITEKYGDVYVGNLSEVQNTENNNPHEAIRVTNLRVREVVGENRIGALYNLIWKRTLESCMSVYQYDDGGYSISAPDNGIYKGNIEIPVFLGWKRITTTDLDLQETQEKVSGVWLYLKTQSKKMVPYQRIECKPGILERESHYTEAGLIQKMEKLGIGRPSTFSLLVGTIQERKYVDKSDIEGRKMECIEFCLEDGNIKSTKKLQTFGSEKNKLVLQGLGGQAVTKLMTNFESLFSYDYTSSMEEKLDDIAEGKVDYVDVCRQCEEVLKASTKDLKDKMKKSYKIDDTYELVFGKTTAMLQHVNADGTKMYKSINTDIELDFDKLESQSYTLNELIDEKDHSLGTYQGHPLEMKKGPFGVYVSWGDNKESLKGLLKKNQTMEDLTREEIIQYLETKTVNPDILRTIDNNMFIKTGKYGPYIQYQKDTWKKPKFIGLKKCRFDYLVCSVEELKEWLKTEHNLHV